MNIDDFLPYMRDVVRCESSLRELNLTWRMIEATAKMTLDRDDDSRSLLPMMAATRERFQKLETDLVERLVHQKVENVMDEVGTQARHVIDVVVRNLYERTADVGFLAMDETLCRFMAELTDDQDAICDRLRAYQSKYTVYDEIILVAPDGRVRAHLDTSTPLSHTHDPLIERAMRADGFVEGFECTDLRPGAGPALVYAHKMQHPDTRQTVGVLCLVFAFDTEMAGIFRARHDPEGRSNMLLLDSQDRVIASADPQWIPLGMKVPTHRSQHPRLCLIAGRQYLIQTFASPGYQGYAGPPGWQSQVVVPLDVAFGGSAGGVLQTLEVSLTEGLLHHARTFCPPLHAIVTAADAIQRVVWNGQAMTAGRRRSQHGIKSVLDQISETGKRTNEVFVKAIRELYDTVLASRLDSARFVTQLLVELLDRNLYERANDCRWWALTPVVRSTLADPARLNTAQQVLGPTLDHINGLYTVYTRLVVYDRNGRIVATSRHDPQNGSDMLGRQIAPDVVHQVMRLPHEQAYHVEPFGPSSLYDGHPTYIYHAAIRAPGRNDVVGGIGIVFDATRELKAMLDSGVGQQGQALALFASADGTVLASQSAAHPAGSVLRLPDGMAALKAGEARSEVVIMQDQYVVLSCAASPGYREFKTSDGHRDDVLAVLMHPLGEVVQARRNSQQQDALQDDSHSASDPVEVATFMLERTLYGVPAVHVLQAVSAGEMRTVSVGAEPYRLGIVALQREGRHDGHVWVYDLHAMLGGQPAAQHDAGQVIVLQLGDDRIGLLVHELHGVPAFDRQRLAPAPGSAWNGTLSQPLVQQLIRANEGRLLIQMLDVGSLWRALGRREPKEEATRSQAPDDAATGEAPTAGAITSSQLPSGVSRLPQMTS